MLSRSKPRRTPSSSKPNPIGPRPRTYGGCANCRARGKKCPGPPSSGGGCSKCLELNMECLEGYGKRRAPWMKDVQKLAQFKNEMKAWIVDIGNRRKPFPPPLLLRHYAGDQTGAAAPVVATPVPEPPPAPPPLYGRNGPQGVGSSEGVHDYLLMANPTYRTVSDLSVTIDPSLLWYQTPEGYM